MDWFEKLMGFREGRYAETRERLEIAGPEIRSKINGRAYATGRLETPTLGELRSRARSAARTLSGILRVGNVVGDARRMHRDPGNARALFQVASQFNLLEMTGPSVVPEDGVTRYEEDATQGPACAIAAGAATIYRNYFAPIEGGRGQTRDRQIDCLQGLGVALGNEDGSLWSMRNGYALATERGLAAIESRLAAISCQERDTLRDLLRIGLHWDVPATEAPEPHPVVSQAFCSALPVAYSSLGSECWEPFASLVLEGAYEATLWAAVLNAVERGSPVVYLTQLGGGAFGNPPIWIHRALRRGLRCLGDVELDVRIVSHARVDPGLEDLARSFA